MKTTTSKWYWGILIIVTLALRFSALDVTLLAPDEVHHALPAWDAAQGNGWPAETESPLLLMGNTLVFTIFGAGNGSARILPTLIGSLLIGLPYLWRKNLGEEGALIAASVLVISPIALFASRHLDSIVIGVAGAVSILTALYQSEEGQNHDRTSIILYAAGTAVGLTGGGPTFYDALIPGLVAWGIQRYLLRDRAILNLTTLKYGVGIGIALALLLSTGLGLRWDGWNGLANGLTAWLTGWGPITPSAYARGLLLFLYEPLTLLLAGISIGYLMKDAHSLPSFLIIWTWIAWALTVVRQGAGPLSQISPLMPLSLLAGWGGRKVLADVVNGVWIGEKIHALLVLIFWGFAGLALARHSSHLMNGTELILVMLIFFIQGLLIIGFGTLTQAEHAWRGLLWGTMAILLTIQLAFAWGANYIRQNNPVEPLVETASSADLQNLQQILNNLQRVQGKSQEEFKVVITGSDTTTMDVLRWVLRDLPALRIEPEWPDDPSTAAVIAPETFEPPTGSVSLFQGMVFTTIVESGQNPIPGCNTDTLPPTCQYPLQWYIYRKSPTSLQRERVVLWATAPAP